MEFGNYFIPRAKPEYGLGQEDFSGRYARLWATNNPEPPFVGLG